MDLSAHINKRLEDMTYAEAKDYVEAVSDLDQILLERMRVESPKAAIEFEALIPRRKLTRERFLAMKKEQDCGCGLNLQHRLQ